MLNICVITGPGFGILGPPGGKSHLFFFKKKENGAEDKIEKGEFI